MWDSLTGTRLLRLDGSTHASGRVAWSPDEQLVAGTHRGGAILIWDVGTGAVRLVLSGYPDAHELAWSPDGTCLATSGVGGHVRVIDLRSARSALLRLESLSQVDWVDDSAIAVAGPWGLAVLDLVAPPRVPRT